jgi:hypothetical protein
VHVDTYEKLKQWDITAGKKGTGSEQRVVRGVLSVRFRVVRLAMLLTLRRRLQLLTSRSVSEVSMDRSTCTRPARGWVF